MWNKVSLVVQVARERTLDLRPACATKFHLAIRANPTPHPLPRSSPFLLRAIRRASASARDDIRFAIALVSMSAASRLARLRNSTYVG